VAVLPAVGCRWSRTEPALKDAFSDFNVPKNASSREAFVTTELADAVERLYRTFAVYPLPEYTDPCLHCHSSDEEEKLRSKPLQELGLDELRDYANDALLVWGDIRVFKHFLPRIFDLYMNVADPSLEISDPEIIFSKFRHGRWRTWPKAEQDAVELFLRAVWNDVLKHPPVEGSYGDVESWLCAIGQSEDDLILYLEHWEKDESQSACLALSGFLLSSAIALSSSHGRNAFWENRDPQYLQLQIWAKSGIVQEKLTRASEKWPEIDEFKAAISIVR
jgi:hypothetical protein